MMVSSAANWGCNSRRRGQRVTGSELVGGVQYRFQFEGFYGVGP